MDFSQKINRKVKKNIASKGNQVPEWPRWSSGSLSLDVELGGGLPKGKIIGLVGPFSSGKTALALLTVAEYQKSCNEAVLWVDAEGAWDPRWARALGVDTARIDVVRPEYGEQAYDIVLAAYDEGAGLAVLDSVAALASKKELEEDMEAVQVGGMSKINAKFMRKVAKDFSESENPPTFIYINQFRQNIGGYGSPLIETGGEALTKYFPSVKIILRAGEYYDGNKVYKTIGIDDEGVEVKAQVVRFYVEKNKTAPPKRRGHFWFYFDTLDALRRKGTVDRLEECIRLARKYKVVEQSTSMFYLTNDETGEQRQFKGADALAKFIREDDRAREYIERKVLQHVIGDMSGEEEAREDPIQEEQVAHLQIVRDDEPEGDQSSKTV